jgi:hypothetical protein
LSQPSLGSHQAWHRLFCRAIHDLQPRLEPPRARLPSSNVRKIVRRDMMRTSESEH